MYAKIINNETKEVIVVENATSEFIKANGYSEINVEQAYNGFWYVAGYAPEEPAPTYEEIDKLRVQYRHEHIDDKTIARMRKTANGTWTEEDEQAYLALDAEVTAWIEENLPYPVENDPEYDTQL